MLFFHHVTVTLYLVEVKFSLKCLHSNVRKAIAELISLPRVRDFGKLSSYPFYTKRTLPTFRTYIQPETLPHQRRRFIR